MSRNCEPGIIPGSFRLLRREVLLSLLVACSLPSTARSGALSGQVRRVIDGDTLDVEIRVLDTSGQPGPLEIRVRFIGIDTPEMNTWNPQKPPERCAREARKYLVDRIPPGTEIQLVADRARKRGRYNRHLFYVETPAGRDLGLDLLRAGLAREVDFEKTPYQRRARYRKVAGKAHPPSCQ